jgi:hypothetical protein
MQTGAEVLRVFPSPAYTECDNEIAGIAIASLNAN